MTSCQLVQHYHLHLPHSRGQVSEPIDHYQNFRQIRTTAVSKQKFFAGNQTATSKNKGDDRPCIYLAGRWLEQAGFVVGASVQVEVFDDMLVLRKEA